MNLPLHYTSIGCHALAYEIGSLRYRAVCDCGWRGSDHVERKHALAESAKHRKTMREAAGKPT